MEAVGFHSSMTAIQKSRKTLSGGQYVESMLSVRQNQQEQGQLLHRMRAESTSGDSGDKESISPTGPEDMMKRYYQLISERRYDEAYAMRSSRTTSSRDEFIDAWKNNISISPEIESVSPIDGSGNEALAVCRLHSVDYDNKQGFG